MLTVKLQPHTTTAEPTMEFKRFSFHYIVESKACGAGKPATMLVVLKTWKVSNKSPHRIQLLSLHFGFVFHSTLKRNQWTYKCADMTSHIIPLGLDTSAAMEQLCSGNSIMALTCKWAKPMQYHPVLMNAWFFAIFICCIYFFDAFIVPQNNSDVFVLRLLQYFFPQKT